MEKSDWFTSKVIRGNQFGRFLGYPTINLAKSSRLKNFNPGVYAANIKIDGKVFQGALYYGPRIMLGEKSNRLEIFILDYNNRIYGEEISFQVLNFIRAPMDFKYYSQYKNQLDQDIKAIKKSFSSKIP